MQSQGMTATPRPNDARKVCVVVPYIRVNEAYALLALHCFRSGGQWGSNRVRGALEGRGQKRRHMVGRWVVVSNEFRLMNLPDRPALAKTPGKAAL